eukprot:gene29053-38454_t
MGNSNDDAPKVALTSSTSLPAVVKFEEKIRFNDVLAVSDGYSVGIWNATSGAKIMEVSNKHSQPNRISGTLAGKVANSSGTTSTTTSEVYTPLATPRITAMKWINEAYDSLLMLGCDDGSVRVWRDVSSTDALDGQSNPGNINSSGSHMNASSSYHGGGATGNAGNIVNSASATVNNAVELVTSFSALPD